MSNTVVIPKSWRIAEQASSFLWLYLCTFSNDCNVAVARQRPSIMCCEVSPITGAYRDEHRGTRQREEEWRRASWVCMKRRERRWVGSKIPTTKNPQMHNSISSQQKLNIGLCTSISYKTTSPSLDLLSTYPSEKNEANEDDNTNNRDKKNSPQRMVLLTWFTALRATYMVFRAISTGRASAAVATGVVAETQAGIASIRLKNYLGTQNFVAYCLLPIVKTLLFTVLFGFFVKPPSLQRRDWIPTQAIRLLWARGAKEFQSI